MEDKDLFTLDQVSRALGDTKVLDKVSVGIPRGKVVFVCGLSASGKSTLLNLLGLLRPGLDGGEVTLRLPGKHPIRYSEVTPRNQIELRSREFGFVLQSSYLLPYMCGRRNLLMPLAIHDSLPRNERRERVDKLLSKVSQLLFSVPLDSEIGLDSGGVPVALRNAFSQERTRLTDNASLEVLAPGIEWRIDDGKKRFRLKKEDDRLNIYFSDLRTDSDRLPQLVSGGQRQRLSVLRAIIHNPSVVFADEPCASLDHVNRELVMSLLRDWRDDKLWIDTEGKGDEPGDKNKDRTLIIVSHDVDSVLEHADVILVMRQGRGVETVSRKSLGDDPWKAKQTLEQKMDGRSRWPTSH